MIGCNSLYNKTYTAGRCPPDPRMAPMKTVLHRPGRELERSRRRQERNTTYETQKELRNLLLFYPRRGVSSTPPLYVHNSYSSDHGDPTCLRKLPGLLPVHIRPCILTPGFASLPFSQLQYSPAKEKYTTPNRDFQTNASSRQTSHTVFQWRT